MEAIGTGGGDMKTRTSRRARMRILATSAFAILALAAIGPSPASAARCPGAYMTPGNATMTQLHDATLCLLNAERRKRGLTPVRQDERLRLAATRHSKDMVNRRYFSHYSPGGASMTDRIRKTSYISSVRSWAIGENIAWGSGRYATPHSIVDMWMHSAGHRANILARNFREIGIGIARGAPVRGQQDAGTFTTDFGVRG